MSKVNEVARMLRRMITQGELRAGDLLPTRNELQERFSAGPLTIHRAMSQLADEGFVLSRRGARIRVAPTPPHTSCYGLVRLSSGHDEALSRNGFEHAMLMAAQRFNQVEPRRQISFYRDVAGHADSEDFQRLCDDVDRVRLAGVLFIYSPGQLLGHSILEQPRVPMLAIGSNQVTGSAVGLRLMSGPSPQRMAQVLRQQRRRVIAFLGPPSHFDYAPAMEATLEAAGMTMPKRWQVRCGLSFPEGARDLTRLIFSSPKPQRPDGLIVADDNLLEHAIAGILDAGRRIPDEVGVVSHWNFPMPAPRMVPFTRVGYDAREVLATALDLCDRFRNDLTGGRLTEPLDCALQLRVEQGEPATFT